MGGSQCKSEDDERKKSPSPVQPAKPAPPRRVPSPKREEPLWMPQSQQHLDKSHVQPSRLAPRLQSPERGYPLWMHESPQDSKKNSVHVTRTFVNTSKLVQPSKPAPRLQSPEREYPFWTHESPQDSEKRSVRVKRTFVNTSKLVQPSEPALSADFPPLGADPPPRSFKSIRHLKESFGQSGDNEDCGPLHIPLAQSAEPLFLRASTYNPQTTKFNGQSPGYMNIENVSSSQYLLDPFFADLMKPKEENIEEMVVSPLLGKLMEKLEELYDLQQQFNASHTMNKMLITESLLDTYLQWVKVDMDVYEKYTLAGVVPESDPAFKVQESSQLLRHFDVYSEMSLPWRLVFRGRSYYRLKSFTEQKRARALNALLELASGKFRYGLPSLLIETTPHRYLIKIADFRNLEEIVVVALEMNQIPIVEKGHLRGFSFYHFMRVVDFVGNQGAINVSFREYLSERKEDLENLDNTLGKDLTRTQNAQKDFMQSVDKVQNGSIGPKHLANYRLIGERQVSFHFDSSRNRWTETQTEENFEDEATREANSRIISELVDSESCKLLVEFMQNKSGKLPYTLSPQELEAIGQSGNVMIIGRSGTGKTTCAMMRMLASQGVYRARLRQRGMQLTDVSALHNVFITASPTLTIEVKRQYEALVAKLANKVAPKTPETEEDENFSDIQIKQSMYLMTRKDFPMFTTARLLVMAIDASLEHPFFKQVLGCSALSGQASFHNELKNVKIISHREQFKEKETNQEKPTQSKKRQKKRAGEDLLEETSFEVDYECFSRRFWPLLFDKVPLDPAVIWSEISGKIKGSLFAHRSSSGFIDKATYLTVSKKTSELIADDKELVWTTFLKYEEWKREKNAYDFQDVVNHVLREVIASGYRGAAIHYLMIDEVQDLSYATLLLLTMVTTNNFVLAGDTAQTIAKGANFRFKDLTALFASYGNFNIEAPVHHQLQVNYRSQDNILQLANCIVEIITLLFPKTIDKFNSESGSRDADFPKPVVLVGRPLQHIVDALADESNPKENFIFGSDQVILVPNDEVRKALPDALSDILSLTIAESKGLEFSDVIIYDFFDHCGVSNAQWQMLRGVLFNSRRTGTITEELKLSPSFISSYKAAHHMSLCSALKSLYVAITRARFKLIIFESGSSEVDLLSYFMMRGLATSKPHISKSRVQFAADQSEAGKAQWYSRGQELMREKKYLPAAKCFRHAGKTMMQRKAELLYEAEELSKQLQAAESVLSSQCTEVQMKEASEKKQTAMANFVRTGNTFREINEPQLAAQCYHSGGEFATAAELYEDLGLLNECGDSWKRANEFLKSAKAYQEANNIIQAIEAFKLAKSWRDCALLYYKIKHNYKLEQRLIQIKEFIKLYFDDLYDKFAKEKADQLPVTHFKDLKRKEQESLIEQFNRNKPFVPVSLQHFVEIGSVKSGYLYVSQRHIELRPQGRVISYNESPDNAELMREILSITSLYYKDICSETAQKRAMEEQFSPQDKTMNAIEMLKKMEMKQFSYLLFNASRKSGLALDYIISLFIALSPVSFIRSEKRNLPESTRVRKYYAGLPLVSIYKCLEMTHPDIIERLLQLPLEESSELVLHGYWKLMLALRTDPPLSISYAFGDFLHTKMYYKLNHENCFSGDGQLLEETSESHPSIKHAMKEILLHDFEAAIIALNSRYGVTQAQDTSVTGPEIHPSFSWNNKLWQWMQGSLDSRAFQPLLAGLFERMRGISDATGDVDEVEIVDLFSFFTQLVCCFRLPKGKELLDSLTFAQVQVLCYCVHQWNLLADTSDHNRFCTPGYRYLLRGSLVPFGIRMLPVDGFLCSLSVLTHVTVSAKCIFFDKAASMLTLSCVDLEGGYFLGRLSDVLNFLRVQFTILLSERIVARGNKVKAMLVDYREFAPGFKEWNYSEDCLSKSSANLVRAAVNAFGEICHAHACLITLKDKLRPKESPLKRSPMLLSMKKDEAKTTVRENRKSKIQNQITAIDLYLREELFKLQSFYADAIRRCFSNRILPLVPLTDLAKTMLISFLLEFNFPPRSYQELCLAENTHRFSTGQMLYRELKGAKLTSKYNNIAPISLEKVMLGIRHASKLGTAKYPLREMCCVAGQLTLLMRKKPLGCMCSTCHRMDLSMAVSRLADFIEIINHLQKGRFSKNWVSIVLGLYLSIKYMCSVTVSQRYFRPVLFQAVITCPEKARSEIIAWACAPLETTKLLLCVKRVLCTLQQQFKKEKSKKKHETHDEQPSVPTLIHALDTFEFLPSSHLDLGSLQHRLLLESELFKELARTVSYPEKEAVASALLEHSEVLSEEIEAYQYTDSETQTGRRKTIKLLTADIAQFISRVRSGEATDDYLRKVTTKFQATLKELPSITAI